MIELIDMDWDYRPILSGERKDPIAFALRGALRVASWPYRAGVNVRNRKFDRGLDVHDCGVPVISVGNLTTGGTGKTPIVCYLAKQLRQRGIRVALVSRGYGRGEADANDEAMELHDRLPDVPHIQDPDRVEAARIAVEELEAEIVLMDDGMQHRRLRRALNIVVIDATCPFGFGYLLPRGLLREPLSGLKRADLCIVSRANSVSDDALRSIENQIHAIADSLPIIRSEHQPAGLITYGGSRSEPPPMERIESLKGKKVAAVSAIGNPQAFEQTVERVGMQIVDARHFPDHDPYEPETVRELMQWAGQLESDAELIVCTHKDLVKLRTDRLGRVPLKALQIELQVTDGIEILAAVIEQTVSAVKNAT
ncbi:MAG: tetraacyldisaccharide 4'-kinase [Planctomycetota bacterium]